MWVQFQEDLRNDTQATWVCNYESDDYFFNFYHLLYITYLLLYITKIIKYFKFLTNKKLLLVRRLKKIKELSSKLNDLLGFDPLDPHDGDREPNPVSTSLTYTHRQQLMCMHDMFTHIHTHQRIHNILLNVVIVFE